MQFQFSLLTLAIFSITHVYADTEVLPEITIKSSAENKHAYNVKQSSSATKLNISTQETPQTVNVVTRQQLDDFHLTSTRDVLNNTPGVTVTGLETNRTTYTSRGFDISNIMVDGLGIPQIDSYNYNGADPDSYFYDRIEVVKGADALTNALGDPGATINYVRKRPTQDFQAEGGISYGSWDTKRYEADISGSLTQDGRVRGRLTAFEKTGNSYLDHYSEEKNGIQGIIEADLTNSTTASVGYAKTHQLTNGAQWGALPLINDAGQQLSYDRNYNYAPSWTYYDWDIDNYFANIQQKLGDNWTAKLSFDEKDATLTDKMLYLSGVPSSTNNTAGVTLYPEIYNQKFKDRTVDLNLNGSYPLFGKTHQANFGYSWSQHQVNSVYAYGDNLGETTTDLASWSPQEPTWGELNAVAKEMFITKSVYGATRLTLTDQLKLLLGANYTQINNKNTYIKNKTSPYAGITYNFTPNYTGYASYTSIFRPQTVLDSATNQVAVPVEGKSYEVGLKGAWLNQRLTGSFAVFRTEQDNFPLDPVYNPIDFKSYSYLGTVRSQGIELGLSGAVTDNLNVSMGYTKFSLKNTQTGENPRPYNPTQSFNVLANYIVPLLPQLKVGTSLKWQDRIYDTSNGYGLIQQSSYLLVGLMAKYDLNPHVAIQLNGDNLTNKKYLTGLKDGQGYYGASANYTVAVKFKY
ncbi:TonB-dependent siderophore receptor [Acinetobacter sp. HY1485]|uniref:TonB-dependent siderophore receptor n=1 Tax=Acinetobacter sp. HY1485 TaxID=2970918 RepID=UPI0022B96F07|nr:TonB-dependent siderophore receptor [Acinetobacter sp. HY1485]